MKFLIAGLGNIGAEYDGTRHNIGFTVLDKFAENHSLRFELDRLAWKTELKYKGKVILLIKPTTYMNLSGKAVAYWLQSEKIEISRLLVVTDDLHLPLGTMRLRAKGSSGGQNGLNHINETLNTEAYARLRMGIGSEFPRGQQVAYVLSKFKSEELTLINPLIQKATEAILSFCIDGVERAMNIYNTK